MAYASECQTFRPRYVQAFVDRHGISRYYFRKGNLRRVPLPNPASAEFQSAYDAALKSSTAKPTKRQDEARKIRMSVGNLNLARDYLAQGIKRASSRAKSKKLDFDLTLEWAEGKAREQGYRCALTGIQFFAERKNRSKYEPFSPSFDRIDPGQGYTQNNVRIVLFAVNVMLQDWGLHVLQIVAQSLKEVP